MFHYAFEQVKIHKMLTAFEADNYKVLDMVMRAGWTLETIIEDVGGPGRGMVVLGMTKASCPWLKYRPKQWMPNHKDAA